MEENRSGSRIRTRRSDRYAGLHSDASEMQKTDVLPTDAVTPRKTQVFAEGTPAQEKAHVVNLSQEMNETPPARMQRPPRMPQQKREAPKKERVNHLPWYQWSMIAVTLVLLGSLLFAGKIMDGYLERQEKARQSAHQAVMDAHPVLYREMIEQYAAENNLEPAFVMSIILNESSYRPDAESGVGARGLMQLMPDTAEWIAGKLKVDGYSFYNMYEPGMNIRFGTWYLGYLANMFHGDAVLVASAYHAGQGTVTGWLSDTSISSDGRKIDLDQLPDGPTKVYAGRVTRDYGIYQALYYSEEDAGDTAGYPADAV